MDMDGHEEGGEMRVIERFVNGCGVNFDSIV